MRRLAKCALQSSEAERRVLLAGLHRDRAVRTGTLSMVRNADAENVRGSGFPLVLAGCRENYGKFVINSESARIGRGTRFLSWLQANQPRAFERVGGEIFEASKVNRKGGRPKKFWDPAERKRARKQKNAQRQRSWRRRNVKPSRKSLRKKDV